MSSRWRSTISSGTLSRLVVGVTPGDWYSQALYQPTDARDGFWQGLREGEVGLSEIAASRLGVAAGETVELPTVEGPKRYRVAGIFRPQMVNDTAVGDIVLVVGRDWRAPIGRPCATRSRWPIRPPPTRPPTATISSNLGAGLSVYDNEQWRSVATTGITRFLQPFTIAGVRGDGGRRPERAERVRAGTRATQA